MPELRKRGFRNRVYANVKMYLDDFFVRKGYYNNIGSGEINYEGIDESQLLPVQNDPLYPVDSGMTIHVWQGYRKNWVSESGLTFTASGLIPPTIVSGIFVNGEFLPARFFDGVSGIGIDKREGRVIIESGIPAESTVLVNHSTKEVWVDTVARDMITNQVSIIDNTKRVAINNVPSGEIGQLPMVLMEIANEPTARGMQLGAGIIRKPGVFLHVIAAKRYDKDEVVDALQLRQHQSITFVDFDEAPSQFTFYGNYDTNYKSYSTLGDNHLDRYVRIEDINLISNDDVAQNGYYTALLKMDLEIWIPEEV
jgi:hypothetical protein